MTQSHATPDALLTKEEVAERFRIPVRTLNYWIETGTAPPSARIGRRRYWRESEVNAFIDAKFDSR